MNSFASFFRQFQQNLRSNLRAMASTPSIGTSLSARTPTPVQRQPPNKQDGSLHHAPAASDVTEKAHKQLCSVKPLDIKVSSSDSVKVRAFGTSFSYVLLLSGHETSMKWHLTRHDISAIGRRKMSYSSLPNSGIADAEKQ